MALERTERYPRRALLAGALGAIGAAAAATIAGAQRVLAAGSDGETVVVGGDYPDVRSPTTFRAKDREGSSPPAYRFRYEPPGDFGYLRQTVISADRIVNTHRSDMSGKIWETTIGRGGIRVYGGKGDAQISVSTQFGTALVGRTTEGTGVSGRGEVGVRGVGHEGSVTLGRGGVFAGEQAQVRLVPSAATTHPEFGATGDLFVDAGKRLWFCRAGRSWVQLA